MGLRTTLLALFIPFFITAQVIPDHRKVDWSRAGNTVDIQPPSEMVNIMNVGGISDQSASNNFAFQAAISQLNGGAGSIYFPNGSYLFNQTIELPDSTWLVGESSNVKLVFDLGGNGHCIQMAGGQSTDTLWIASAGTKDEIELEVENASPIAVGEMLRIGMNDEDLAISEWAHGFVGQCVMVDSVVGNTVVLQDPLNMDLDMIREPFAVRVIPRVNAGVQCLSIERLDNSVNHYITIDIERAYNCAVYSVISDMTVNAHVGISSCCHVEVKDSYFKNAFSYGGGGEGYGAVVQYASSYNLVESNVFEHLRHAMLIQAGASANVYAYNYSLDSFWDQSGFPTNAAGDIVLHGNYPFLNLFEGNVAQNIVVDASHDVNGPFNTFFRNRVELYGIIMDNNTPTDSLNWIGNEVAATGFPLGNFALYGVGHLSHGNNVFGVATPLGTEIIADTSLYLNSSLQEFGNTWPLIGYPAGLSDNDLPAQERYAMGEFTACTDAVITDVKTENQLHIWQDDKGSVRVDPSLIGGMYKVYTSDGKLVDSGIIDGINLRELTGTGVFIIEIHHQQIGLTRAKVVGF
ncbi:MAG: hypothetical protein ACI85F_001165 [Bacteroidia bacterium]|jgi:hypothetical protein